LIASIFLLTSIGSFLADYDLLIISLISDLALTPIHVNYFETNWLETMTVAA